MQREQARDRFLLLYASGLPLGAVLNWLDPPRAIGIVIVAPWIAAVVFYGWVSLARAVDDGSLRHGIPEYLRAFLGLLTIAGLFALATVLVLLALGEEVSVNAASSGAAVGALAVAFTWPMLQAGRRHRRRDRAVDNSG